MNEMTLEAVQQVTPDVVLDGIALDTPLEYSPVGSSIFPDSQPGPSSFNLPDWGAQGLQTLTGTIRGAESETPPTFDIEVPSKQNILLEPHWGQTRIDGTLSAMLDERALFRRVSSETRKTQTLKKRWVGTKELFARTALSSNLVFDAQNSTAIAVGDKWTLDTSDPVSVVFAKKEAVALKCGVIPNKMFISYSMFTRFCLHPKIIARFGANATAPLTKAQLERVFQLEEIVVGQSIVNTAKAGQAKSLEWTWPAGDVYLYYQAKLLNEESRTFAACFRWYAAPAEKWYRVQNDPDWYHIRFAEVFKYAIVDRLCAHKWTGAY